MPIERRDKTAIEIVREEAIANPDRIGFIDPQVAGKLITEHFEHLTAEQFDANNRRANPHMYPEASQAAVKE